MKILNFMVNSTSKKEYNPNCLTKVTAPKRIKFQVAEFMHLLGTNINYNQKTVIFFLFIYSFVVYWTLLLVTACMARNWKKYLYKVAVKHVGTVWVHIRKKWWNWRYCNVHHGNKAHK